MKKRAAKTKGSTKAKRAAKPSASRSVAPKARAASASYTPAPLKGDGWPPFRYQAQ